MHGEPSGVVPPVDAETVVTAVDEAALIPPTADVTDDAIAPPFPPAPPVDVVALAGVEVAPLLTLALMIVDAAPP